MTLAASHVALKGSRRFHRPGAEVLGPADAGEWCEITLKVRRKEALPEPDPAKPKSREELVTTYGANSADFATVEKELSSFGLTLVSTNKSARSEIFAGPVSAMEKAFGVRLLRVKHNDVLYRGRVGDIHIPAALDGIVTGVFGLDTRPMVKRRKPLTAQASHGTLPPPNQRAWYLPQELATAYKFPDGDGSGQTIAILEFGGKYVDHDLKTFWQTAGLGGAAPAVQVRQVQAFSSKLRNDADFIGEVMLDIEIVAAICPKAKITAYFSNWSEQGWNRNLDAVLADEVRPTVVSISYGLAEGSDIWTQDAIDSLNDTLKELANAGVTVCVSSGDDGSDDQVGDGAAHIDFPSTSPYVLSVGGTALTRSTQKEVVWFDGDGLRRDGGGSGGGGVSSMNARPSWQAAIDIPSANPHTTPGRIVPDVAANAAGSTGYFMVAQGNAEVSGGTSAATPLWASLIARIQQGGKTVGFLTPRLYAPTPKTGGKPLGAVAFRDITQGSNASGSAPGYSAQEGFDAVTGWGSPIGTALLANLP